MAQVFSINPVALYDSDNDQLIDIAETAQQPIYSPTPDEDDNTHFILTIEQKNGIIDFNNASTKVFFIPDNEGGLVKGDYFILALRGEGEVQLIPKNLADISVMGDISLTLSSGQQYVLRNLNDNDWMLSTFGGGGSGFHLVPTQPTLNGLFVNLDSFSQYGDSNGIFYYLGAESGSYTNVIDGGQVTVSTNSPYQSGNPSNMTGRGSNTLAFTINEGKYLQLSLSNQVVIFPQLVTIYTQQSKRLGLSGSPNGVEWFDLGQIEALEDNTSAWRSLTPESNPGFYAHFRITDLGDDNTNWGIREIEFYGDVLEPEYSYTLTNSDKGKLLVFYSPTPQEFYLNEEVSYLPGEGVYLQNEGNSITLVGDPEVKIRGYGGIDTKLELFGTTYCLIKDVGDKQWRLLAINPEPPNDFNEETLIADKVLTDSDRIYQILNPGEENRNVILPDPIKNLRFIIINDSEGTSGLYVRENSPTEEFGPVLVVLDNQTEKIAECLGTGTQWLIETRGNYS